MLICILFIPSIHVVRLKGMNCQKVFQLHLFRNKLHYNLCNFYEKNNQKFLYSAHSTLSPLLFCTFNPLPPLISSLIYNKNIEIYILFLLFLKFINFKSISIVLHLVGWAGPWGGIFEYLMVIYENILFKFCWGIKTIK